MYQALRTPGGAGQQYRTIDITSKIEGASPHRLVTILYEELVLSLAGIKTAVRQRNLSRINEGRARAQSIVQTLDASLDHARGGDVAGALSRVYREADRLIATGCRTMDADAIGAAQMLIAEIAEAWGQIG